MAQLFDENGVAVEAFTAEELKAKQEEAIAEHLKNNPDKSSEVSRLQTELADANAKLADAEKAGGNDGQKERLKAAKELAEEALKAGMSKFENEVRELRETITAGTKNKVLAALSKGDAAAKEKIELRYNSLMKTGDYKNDEAGITQALTDATTLVTGNKPAPSFMDNMSGAGERGAAQGGANAAPESENSKAMRAALGIKDADAAKYGNKPAV
jgi:DNA-directed RNA polymerase beta subunit